MQALCGREIRKANLSRAVSRMKVNNVYRRAIGADHRDIGIRPLETEHSVSSGRDFVKAFLRPFRKPRVSGIGN